MISTNQVFLWNTFSSFSFRKNVWLVEKSGAGRVPSERLVNSPPLPAMFDFMG